MPNDPIPVTVTLLGPLGHEIQVPTTDQQLLATIRHFGRANYRPTVMPNGGFKLPAANEPDFDWALIGASDPQQLGDDLGVFWGGEFYKRREYEEVDTKKLKMPAAVKFSRGAKPTDPAHLKEGEEGGVQYVTLILFRGGKRRELWARK